MKKSYDDRVLEAAQDFKNLVIYFCVTRAQHYQDFFDQGSFSIEKLLHMLDFLDNWKSKSAYERKRYANAYAKYSRAINYAFGISKKLVLAALGYARKDDGRLCRIHLDEVLNLLNKDKQTIKVVNAGRKFEYVEDADGNFVHKKDEKGKSVLKCYWCKKYLIADRAYWFSLLKNEKYNDIIKYGSPRLQKIIFKWQKKNKKKNEELEEVEEVKEPKEPKEVVKEEPTLKEPLKPINVYEFLSILKFNKISKDFAKIIAKRTAFRQQIKTFDEKQLEATNFDDVPQFWKRLYLANCSDKSFCDDGLKDNIKDEYLKSNNLTYLTVL